MMGWFSVVPILGRIVEKIVDGRNASRSAKDEIARARQSGEEEVKVSRETLNRVRVKGLDTSWKDELATAVWLQIPCLVVWGAVAAAFGFPQVNQGVIESVHLLNEIMATGPLGEILIGVTAAAVGVTLLRR